MSAVESSDRDQVAFLSQLGSDSGHVCDVDDVHVNARDSERVIVSTAVCRTLQYITQA